MNSQLAPVSPTLTMAIRPAGQADAPLSTVSIAIVTTSVALAAYHGYKRNQSIAWALWWAFAASLLPVVVPAIAIAQGYGQPSREIRRRLREK